MLNCKEIDFYKVSGEEQNIILDRISLIVWLMYSMWATRVFKFAIRIKKKKGKKALSSVH